MISSKRYLEIDFVRGLAIFGMVVFHVFYVLNFFRILPNMMYEGWWLVLVRSVQFSFLGLVGVSLAVSKIGALRKTADGAVRDFYLKQFKRFLMIGVCAVLVTLVTFWALPFAFVRFGILHFIAFSILFYSFFADKLYFSLGFGVWAAWFGVYLGGFETGSWWLAVLGIEGGAGLRTIDHFEIFPWISVVAFGVVIGNLLYGKGKGWLNQEVLRRLFLFRWIGGLGRHSLIIYMLHVPIIVLILMVFGVLPFNVFG